MTLMVITLHHKVTLYHMMLPWFHIHSNTIHHKHQTTYVVMYCTQYTLAHDHAGIQAI